MESGEIMIVMDSEPRGYSVGDAIVKIDDVVDVAPAAKADEVIYFALRVYTFRITKDGVTTAYRCKVALSDIVRKNDQQLAEFLALKSRKTKLFDFTS